MHVKRSRDEGLRTCPLLIFFDGISKNLEYALTEWQLLSINYIYTCLYKHIKSLH